MAADDDDDTAVIESMSPDAAVAAMAVADDDDADDSDDENSGIDGVATASNDENSSSSRSTMDADDEGDDDDDDDDNDDEDENDSIGKSLSKKFMRSLFSSSSARHAATSSTVQGKGCHSVASSLVSPLFALLADCFFFVGAADASSFVRRFFLSMGDTGLGENWAGGSGRREDVRRP